MDGNTGQIKINQVNFIIDSGASHHIINDKLLFEDSLELDTPIQIQTAKREVYLAATRQGTIRISTNTGALGILEGVLFCRDAPANLLSVRQFQMAGLETVFHVDGSISIEGKNNAIMSGKSMKVCQMYN